MTVIPQRSECNNHKAVNQANSVKKNRDVTGIGACVCKHGVVIPHSVVDFHKGEQYVKIIHGSAY